jgi:hypothetical protein
MPADETTSTLTAPFWQVLTGVTPTAFGMVGVFVAAAVVFNPVLPIVSAICCVGLMSNLAVETWLRFLVWLVIGLLIYVFYSRRHARLADPERFDVLYADELDIAETPRD